MKKIILIISLFLTSNSFASEEPESITLYSNLKFEVTYKYKKVCYYKNAFNDLSYDDIGLAAKYTYSAVEVNRVKKCPLTLKVDVLERNIKLIHKGLLNSKRLGEEENF